MYKGLPKITKNLIMTENKFKVFKDWDFLRQQMDAICERVSFKTDQKILEEIFKFTDYEVNSNNYMTLLLTQTLIIVEAIDTSCRYLHVYFHGEHLMNIRVTSECVHTGETSDNKVGYQYVTKIYVEK